MSSINYFNEVADQWDTLRQNFFPEAVREKLYMVAGIEAGKCAADIGCGTGFVTEGLVQKGIKVIAVDFSREMIKQMKSKFSGSGLVDCRLGESENLPIDDSAVDYVLANMYLHHVEKPLVAIREMVRVLRKGGKLVLTDLDEHQFEFLKTEQNDHWMGFKRPEVFEWFQSAGLNNVKIDCVSEHCCASSEQDCLKAQISIFVASGEK